MEVFPPAAAATAAKFGELVSAQNFPPFLLLLLWCALERPPTLDTLVTVI
jgi:hypothetical protein